MNTSFVKNIQFTKLIKVDGRLREFNFRKMTQSSGIQFSVDVSDDKGNRIMLWLQKENGNWTIQEPAGLPSWILKQESILHQHIEEELYTGATV